MIRKGMPRCMVCGRSEPKTLSDGTVVCGHCGSYDSWAGF